MLLMRGRHDKFTIIVCNRQTFLCTRARFPPELTEWEQLREKIKHNEVETFLLWVISSNYFQPRKVRTIEDTCEVVILGFRIGFDVHLTHDSPEIFTAQLVVVAGLDKKPFDRATCFKADLHGSVLGQLFFHEFFNFFVTHKLV